MTARERSEEWTVGYKDGFQQACRVMLWRATDDTKKHIKNVLAALRLLEDSSPPEPQYNLDFYDERTPE
jgi:hypothetical protein